MRHFILKAWTLSDFTNIVAPSNIPLHKDSGDFLILTCHRGRYTSFLPVSAPRGYTRDEGRPLGVGLQEQASNRFKLHRSRALVVSVEGKDMAMTMSGAVQGDERKRTTDEVSKRN
jgi:hypothetical protein